MYQQRFEMQIRPKNFEEISQDLSQTEMARNTADEWKIEYFDNKVDRNTQIKFQCEPGKSISQTTSGVVSHELETTCQWAGDTWEPALEEPASCICN